MRDATFQHIIRWSLAGGFLENAGKVTSAVSGRSGQVVNPDGSRQGLRDHGIHTIQRTTGQPLALRETTFTANDASRQRWRARRSLCSTRR